MQYTRQYILGKKIYDALQLTSNLKYSYHVVAQTFCLELVVSQNSQQQTNNQPILFYWRNNQIK